MHLCINYQKVSRIETSIGNAVIDKIIENNGTYVPPSVQTSHQIFFAVDNSEFKNDTCDGKNEFHGVITTVYQPSRDNANCN